MNQKISMNYFILIVDYFECSNFWKPCWKYFKNFAWKIEEFTKNTYLLLGYFYTYEEIYHLRKRNREDTMECEIEIRMCASVYMLIFFRDPEIKNKSDIAKRINKNYIINLLGILFIHFRNLCHISSLFFFSFVPHTFCYKNQ